MPFFPLLVSVVGATLEVGVSAPLVYLTSKTPPDTWTALVDTGATTSVISPAVKPAPDPPHLSIAPVYREGGVRTFERTYEIRILLGGHRIARRRWFAPEGVELQPATPEVDVIIGSDLLIRLELLGRGPVGNGHLGY